ncbi:TIGR03571 family LLM class oxidoreductase [Frigidibacter albus]|uniref:TIGR03571 family LLM class oxidoreductase n=1 Tax=Frigidibacter albus TaxID=1465486 RepID=A0A6L8VG88_9RHOB|nr:LLM class oxidoreductase [Frigidibacter albus]MZQ89263.1 TIGR03571 family LLM class oxidoreductase [Frigidibacter albus]NBE31169.1 TIGR03571 family LLM class oxidoreductase [Frigidibacter albus]GGH53266.1 luciferase [Frigidibacter albus]
MSVPLLQLQVSSPAHPIAGPPHLRSLQEHPGYRRVFQPGRLTFGLVAPLEPYPLAPWPTLEGHAEAVRLVDEMDFAAIWLRDVPFYDPGFGDTGQVLDPMVYAGWLAARTRRIAIGTAGIVLPLRDPLIVAKQAASLDRLSGGRFLLGLATGDRPSEFAAFGSDIGNRVDRYRDALEMIRAATEQSFPRHASRFYGVLDGALDLLPKPVAPRLPIIAIGRAGQSFDWLGNNTDGWLWHLSDPAKLASVVAEWRRGSGERFRPFGYGTMFDLLADPDAPLELRHATTRGGRKALISHWKRQRDEGVNHVALHMKPLQRPFTEAVAEFAEHVLPEFAD